MATKNSVSNQAKYFYHACPWNKLMIHKDISDGSICSTCTRKLGKGSIWYINLNNIRPDHWPINYTDMIIKKIKKASIVPQIFLGPDPIWKNIWNLFMNYDGSRWFGSWVVCTYFMNKSHVSLIFPNERIWELVVYTG